MLPSAPPMPVVATRWRRSACISDFTTARSVALRGGVEAEGCGCGANMVKQDLTLLMLRNIGVRLRRSRSKYFCRVSAYSRARSGTPVLTGFTSGVVASGSLQGGLIGAFGAGVFQGIGSIDMSDGARIIAHGVAGGTMSALQGGKFGHGFASAGVAQAFAPEIGRIGGGAKSAAPARILATVIVGGTSTVLSGGKFANGAVTSALAYAFGHLASSRRPGSPTASAAGSDEPGAYPRFAAEANLTRAQEVFGVLHRAGELDGLGYEFLNDVSGGASNWRFDARYVDTALYLEGYGNVRGTANIHWGGIDIYRGGASTPRMALMTYAHEVLHFKPEYMRAWWADPAWGPRHSATFWPIETRVAQIARTNWYKYVDRHGEWP